MTIDRRAALKERHRTAILAAAAALIQEGDGHPFTVDALAERADVSRRTVFNHFSSLDEIVTMVCADQLSGLVDAFVACTAARPATDDSPAAMLDEVTQAVRATDLVGPMASLTRTLSAYGRESLAMSALLGRVFSDVSVRLANALLERHPSADPLEVRLLITSLTSGLVVLHDIWWQQTDAADDDRSRQVWAELLDRLITITCAGFGHPTDRARPKEPHG